MPRVRQRMQLYTRSQTVANAASMTSSLVFTSLLAVPLLPRGVLCGGVL